MSSNVNQDTYIVTGATGGIGKALVKELVNRNVARVILACRNTALASQLIADYNGADTKLLTIHLDLESFDSVIAFADEVKSRGYMVKALLNNAGTMRGEVRKTSDGDESVKRWFGDSIHHIHDKTYCRISRKLGCSFEKTS